MPKKIQRTVSFYWVALRDRQDVSVQRVDNFDWLSRLSGLNEMSWQEKLFDDTRYDTILDRTYPILTALEKFDPAFMRVADASSQKVVDYMDAMLGDTETSLFNSSAAAFYPEHSLLAHVSGSSVIRKPDAIAKCLNHYFGMSGKEWLLEPVRTKDSLKRFEEEIKGIKSFEVAFPTHEDLFSILKPKEGIIDFYQRVSKRVSAELKIEMKISIEDRTPIKRAMRNLKEVAAETLPFAVEYGSKAMVMGEDMEEALLDLNLIDHAVTEKAEIDTNEGMSLTFSGLINHLVKVCEDKQQELYDIS